MLPVIMAAAQAGANLIGNAINNRAQKKANAKNIQNDWDMWNATNAYNTPLAQRKRMEDAGFNPALMYGNGGINNTTSTHGIADAAPPTSTLGQGIADSIGTYQNMRTQDLNIAKNDADIAKTFSDISLNDTKNATGQYELGEAKYLQQTSRDYKKAVLENAQLRNVAQDIQNTNLPEQHQAAMKESVSRIQLAASTMDKQTLETALHSEELKLRKLGIQSGDNILLRVLAKNLPSIFQHFNKKPIKLRKPKPLRDQINENHPKTKAFLLKNPSLIKYTR